MEVAAARWVDQLAKGEIPVGVHFSDLDRYSTRFDSLARLIAATVLLTGLIIGSAIAATTGAGKSVFRTDVSDAAASSTWERRRSVSRSSSCCSGGSSVTKAAATPGAKAPS